MVDTLVLGTSAYGVEVRVLSSVQKNNITSNSYIIFFVIKRMTRTGDGKGWHPLHGMGYSERRECHRAEAL